MARRELRLSVDDAQAQLDLFFDWYDIDFDEMFEAAQADNKASPIKAIKSKLIRSIRQGRIEIKEVTVGDEPSLQVHQHLDKKVLDKIEIVYKEVTGRARAAVKTVEGANDAARVYQFLGLLSTENPGVFERLRGADIGVTDMIGVLFLMV